MKKKERVIYLLIIFLLLILAAILFWFKISFRQKYQKEKTQTEYYMAKLDTCKNGLEKPLTVEQQLAHELKVKSAPTPITTPTLVIRQSEPKKPRKTQPAPVDVKEQTFTQVFVPVQKEPTKTVTTSYPAENNQLPITSYEGGISGDFGTTITDEACLVYFVKANLIGNNIPRLNSEGGPAFTLQSGYWIYIDKSKILTSEQINNSQYAVVWNIYKGRVNYGTGSYPAFLPHESIKALLTKVRGFEYGEITDEDVQKMSAENQYIKNKTIRPLKLNSHPGRDNANFWHGWNFVTKIYAKRKTVTQ